MKEAGGDMWDVPFVRSEEDRINHQDRKVL